MYKKCYELLNSLSEHAKENKKFQDILFSVEAENLQDLVNENYFLDKDDRSLPYESFDVRSGPTYNNQGKSGRSKYRRLLLL